MQRKDWVTRTKRIAETPNVAMAKGKWCGGWCDARTLLDDVSQQKMDGADEIE